VRTMKKGLLPFPKFLYAYGLILIVSLSTITACTKIPNSPETSGTNPKQLRDERIAELLESFEEFDVDQKGTVTRDQIVAEVTNLANESDTQGIDSPYDTVILRYPESRLALFLFGQRIEELKREDIGKMLSYTNEIRDRVPETAVSRKAVFGELSYLSRHEPESFLQRCEAILESDPLGDTAPAILVQRIEFYRSQHNYDDAALDSIRLWHTFPHVVARIHYEAKIQARLRDARFYLEAITLEALKSQPEKQSILVADLASEFLSGDMRASNLYQELIRDPSIATNSKFDRDKENLWKLRLIAFYGEEGNFERSNRQLRQYLATLEEDAPSAVLGLYHEGIAVYLTRHYKYGSATKRNNQFANNRTDTLLKNNIGLLIESTLNTELANAQYAEDLTESVDHAIEMYRDIQDVKRIVASFELIPYRFPEDNLAPEYLLKLAEYYDNDEDLKEQAISTLELISKDYSDSPQHATAILKKGLLLYELEKYDAGYVVLLEFQTMYEGDSRIWVSKFLSAMCESAMGLDIEAKEHMWAISEESKAPDVAARALFWLGSQELAGQEYEQAKNIFLELTDRYPNSKHAKTAYDYITRLEEF
jgi:outer membrane protein assembly factor BamD (BamD/ComL family)